MKDFVVKHWRKIALFSVGALAGGLSAIGSGGAAEFFKVLLSLLGAAQ